MMLRRLTSILRTCHELAFMFSLLPPLFNTIVNRNEIREGDKNDKHVKAAREGDAEMVQTTRLVRMTFGSEIHSLLESGDGLLYITQIS